MAAFPSLPLWTDAYLGDTMHLSLEEHGAYLKLLIISWRSSDCTLPDDDRRIATMLGITRARWTKKIRPAVESLFTVEGGFWTQKRLVKERKYCEVRREQQSRAGIASALKRQEVKPASVDPPLQREGNPHTHTHTHQGSTKEGTALGKAPTWTPPPDKPPAKKAMNGRRTTLPRGWAPNAMAFEIATKEGYDHGQTLWLAAQFRDSALAHGRQYIDWHRAFHGWIRSEFSRKSLAGRSDSRRPGDAISQAVRNLQEDIQ